MIEDFFHLPPVVHLELQISPRIFEKIRNGPTGILRGLGETDSWKNKKSKISWHCPFNIAYMFCILRANHISVNFSVISRFFSRDSSLCKKNLFWWMFHRVFSKCLLYVPTSVALAKNTKTIPQFSKKYSSVETIP